MTRTDRACRERTAEKQAEQHRDPHSARPFDRLYQHALQALRSVDDRVVDVAAQLVPAASDLGVALMTDERMADWEDAVVDVDELLPTVRTPADYLRVVDDPRLDDSGLGVLAGSPYSFVRLAVARQPRTSATHLLRLLDSEYTDWEYNALLFLVAGHARADRLVLLAVLDRAADLLRAGARPYPAAFGNLTAVEQEVHHRAGPEPMRRQPVEHQQPLRRNNEAEFLEDLTRAGRVRVLAGFNVAAGRHPVWSVARQGQQQVTMPVRHERIRNRKYQF